MSHAATALPGELAVQTVYLWLADLILLLHGLYVGFVVLGYGLIVLGGILGWPWVRNPYFRWAHLLAIGIVAIQGALGVICPLTLLEDHLRVLGGRQAETATFVARWIRRLIFVNVDIWILNVGYVLFTLIVLITMVILPPRPFPSGPVARRGDT
jgi:hypothetical protein